MKTYKIGEYSKYLGVTPDLLKHYEEQGLIESSRSESGYRYFSFHMTSRLIEIIRLRNYGMSLRDIREIVSRHSIDTPEVTGRIQKNIETLRQEASLDMELIEDYEHFLRWSEDLKQQTSDWEIRRSHAMYFLPHSTEDQFLEDPRIYQLLKEWMSYIPIVKSATKIEQNGTIIWGLIIPQDKQKALGLPLNSVVQTIDSCKIFYYKFRGPVTRMEQLKQIDQHPAMQLLAAMNLQPAGSIYRTLLMPSDWKSGIRSQYGYYAIPLKS